MAVEYISTGSVAANAAAITVGLPATRQTDDLLLLLVETANQAVTLTGTDASNWVEITSSPQGTGTAAGTAATRLTVYYRWVDGTEANIGVGDSGDHQIARIINYRGVDKTSPFNVQAGSTRTTAGTSVTYPSVVTTVDNCMVLLMEAHSLPDTTSTAITSGQSNANLSSITERMDNNTNAGNGGGFSLAEGLKATAGTVGTSSATTTSSVGGMITLALAPAPITGDLDATETGSDTFAATGDVLVKGSLAATETGADTFAASGTVQDPAITGTLAATETGNDTFASTGKLIVTGSLAATETDADVFAASGVVLIAGSMAVTETGADVFAASGQVKIAGAVAAQETGADVFAAQGGPTIQGDLSAAETGEDTFLGVGNEETFGDLAATEVGQDIFSATGFLPATGSLAVSEVGQDTIAAAGKIIVTGTIAAIETQEDVFAADGQVQGAVVYGLMAATESGQDVFAATGGPQITGILLATEANDAFESPAKYVDSGYVQPGYWPTANNVIVAGTLSVTESGQDVFYAFYIPGLLPIPSPVALDLPAVQSLTLGTAGALPIPPASTLPISGTTTLPLE